MEVGGGGGRRGLLSGIKKSILNGLIGNKLRLSQKSFSICVFQTIN